MAVSTTVV